MFSLSQNSNVDNILPELDKIPPGPFLNLHDFTKNYVWRVLSRNKIEPILNPDGGNYWMYSGSKI